MCAGFGGVGYRDVAPTLGIWARGRLVVCEGREYLEGLRDRAGGRAGDWLPERNVAR